jgi:ADP-ribose pyrophosphatase YjhB (NUDIX family)
MGDVTDPTDPARHEWLAEGNARQARKRVAAKVLVRDAPGRVLLVDPVYKPFWHLPGGMAESNEPPRAAAARELREEVGLAVPIGRLLVVDWVGPNDPWDDHLVFVFDGGTVTEPRGAGPRIRDPEISAYRFVTVDAAAGLLRPDVHARLVRSHAALTEGTTAYGETGDA